MTLPGAAPATTVPYIAFRDTPGGISLGMAKVAWGHRAVGHRAEGQNVGRLCIHPREASTLSGRFLACVFLSLSLSLSL